MDKSYYILKLQLKDAHISILKDNSPENIERVKTFVSVTEEFIDTIRAEVYEIQLSIKSRHTASSN
jgi:hypothetical protein